jgi:ABC-type polysaccharide/polyol phosphate export permease
MQAAPQTAKATDAAAPESVVAPAPSQTGFGELWRFRQLVSLLVARVLKVRDKRSILGVLWTMMNPLLLMVVYAVVFSTILRAAVPNYTIFLLAGLLPWIFFSNAAMQGLMSVLVNQDLIRKVRVPQAVFPFSIVGSNIVNLALSLVPLAIIMAAVGQRFTAALAFVPVALAILTAFTAGVTLLLATATVFFRDVRHLTEVLLQVVLYLSPVLYDVDQLGEHHSWWFRVFRLELAINPMSYLIELVRAPVYYGRLPPLQTVAIATAYALASLAIGFAVFTRLERRHIHHF